MPDTQTARVAVYLDFDNIVMSWYDRVHGRNAYSRDRQKIAENPMEPEIAERLTKATIDVGAVIDYARRSAPSCSPAAAYADWSAPVNAEYRSQLVPVPSTSCSSSPRRHTRRTAPTSVSRWMPSRTCSASPT